MSMPSHPLPEEPSQYYRPVYIWVKEYQPINLNVLDVNGELYLKKEVMDKWKE
jgi:hypothetical protein